MAGPNHKVLRDNDARRRGEINEREKATNMVRQLPQENQGNLTLKEVVVSAQRA